MVTQAVRTTPSLWSAFIFWDKSNHIVSSAHLWGGRSLPWKRKGRINFCSFYCEQHLWLPVSCGWIYFVLLLQPSSCLSLECSQSRKKHLDVPTKKYPLGAGQGGRVLPVKVQTGSDTRDGCDFLFGGVWGGWNPAKLTQVTWCGLHLPESTGFRSDCSGAGT